MALSALFSITECRPCRRPSTFFVDVVGFPAVLPSLLNHQSFCTDEVVLVEAFIITTWIQSTTIMYVGVSSYLIGLLLGSSNFCPLSTMIVFFYKYQVTRRIKNSTYTSFALKCVVCNFSDLNIDEDALLYFHRCWP